MKLAQLFSCYKYFKMGEEPLRDVTGLTLDSRTAQAGHIFFAVRGHAHDSHDYLKDVCAKGVVGVVVEDETRVPKDFRGAVLVAPDTREAVVRLASRFYESPAEKLFCVGVTGTNGKTSTTYMIEAVLNHFGMKTGVMGTINHHIGEKTWESELTTPDAVTLQKRMREFVALEAKAVAMEVSSHALDQGRAAGVPFACAVFTNLTRDHLDYHKTMEDYFHAKERLFSEMVINNGYAIINANDEWGRRLRVSPYARTWTYGEGRSDFQFQILETEYAGTRFKLQTPRGEAEVRIQLPGRHNVYNAVAAIATGFAAGASLQNCVEGISRFVGVPGRLQRVPNEKGLNVFVDYAHTDDAIRTVLTILDAIRAAQHRKGKIITVFGCGGDRDKGKRPMMAQAAVAGSDTVFVTSDNPRNEDPLEIIADILTGVPKELMNAKVFVEVDRKEAIRRALSDATARDAVVIAGKGHENYQIVGTTKKYFSDVQVASEILNGL